MPSPFPGMDPYLENPLLFPGFHTTMIAGMQGALNRVLRPKYVARIEERVYVSSENDAGRKYLVPDVKLIATGRAKAVTAPSASVAEPIVMVTTLEIEVHDRYLAIQDVQSGKIVTVVELLSPVNKMSRSEGRAEYTEKRRTILKSRVHLVEIDLLRRGKSPFPRGELPPHEYAVHASKSTMRPDGKLWPIRLDQSLPVISVPLKGKDPDAPLDLQAVFTEAYDDAGSDLVIDYRQTCRPRLSAELERWARSVIRTATLR